MKLNKLKKIIEGVLIYNPGGGGGIITFDKKLEDKKYKTQNQLNKHFY